MPALILMPSDRTPYRGFRVTRAWNPVKFKLKFHPEDHSRLRVVDRHEIRLLRYNRGQLRRDIERITGRHGWPRATSTSPFAFYVRPTEKFWLKKKTGRAGGQCVARTFVSSSSTLISRFRNFLITLHHRSTSCSVSIGVDVFSMRERADWFLKDAAPISIGKFISWFSYMDIFRRWASFVNRKE